MNLNQAKNAFNEAKAAQNDTDLAKAANEFNPFKWTGAGIGVALDMRGGENFGEAAAGNFAGFAFTKSIETLQAIGKATSVEAFGLGLGWGMLNAFNDVGTESDMVMALRERTYQLQWGNRGDKPCG